MFDLNKEMFTRKSAETKKKIVKSASEDDLMRVSKDTIIRIVKEVGSKCYKSRDKEMRMYGCEVGNHWNSTLESVGTSKGRLYIGFYVQYSNTDTSDSDWWDNFMCGGDYRGAIHYEDRYGNSQTDYYRYSRSNKAEVVRAILLAYISRKYKAKSAE